MKKIFLILIVIFPPVLSAQIKGDLVLDWLEKKEMNYGDSKIIIPQFKGDSFHYDASDKAIICTYKIGENLISDLGQLLITNVVYEPMAISELGDLSSENIPTEINNILVFTSSRNIKSAFMKFSPIVKGNLGLKRIKSFSYETQSSTQRNMQPSTTTSTISNSVLSQGNWFQFYIEKSGVYKISKRFLEQLGVDLNNVDPKNLKIYGNGGRMLPLANNVFYPTDLSENAIQIIGESDGVFDNEDYILFYGEGVDTWNQESNTNLNLYDNKSFYYLTVQGSLGKRIQPISQPISGSSVTIKTFDSYQFHEVDLVNIARLGRQWFGESFELQNEQEFVFSIPNIDTTVPVKISLVAASAAFTATSFTTTVNGNLVGTINFSALRSGFEIEFITGSLPLNSSFTGAETIKVKLNYNSNGVPGSKGYLDHIRLIAKRKLVGYGKQFHFQYDQSSASTGVVSYNLDNASDISQVWDITDINNISTVINPSQNNFSFKSNLGELRKYVALDASDYFTPFKGPKSKIANQNLKGTLFKNNLGQFQDIDYVIIAPNSLTTQAEKLAVFHRNRSNLNVKVIPLELIYHEFSSGKQDIAAIRNCIKYIYENASTKDKSVKYVNLFGDASYDYKNRIVNNTNVVPIYHSITSNTTGEASFASDDFYGLMDPSEGNITNFFGGIDIAVGRMLVNDAKQADEMINKVIEYHDIKSFGSWRNNYVMISDDSDIVADASLQKRQDILANKIGTEKPFINIYKIFLDAYSQEASAGGNRYPKARTDFFNAFEKGALIFNYLGHGGEDGLSAERIWEKSDSQNLDNQYKYPLFITITCEFSRFDNPFKPTAGEYTYWNPKGGAIAMVTTIRSIGQFSAENFNDNFAKNLLSYGSNKYVSIAEALRISKNSNPNSATNVVFYIGDPALMLAIPLPKIVLTKINDIPINQSIDAFKSLSKMKINGQITDENSNVLTNYKGEVATAIFDKDISRNTLNNDGNSPTINFNVLGETIFRGNASVTNGQFEFNFVVPRDIRVPVANGRISFYSKKNDILQNETGFNSDIKIGGINENAIEDIINPRVKLYMNDETFVSGGITNESPFLVAFLEDENGINTASGIGHDIIAVLDGDISSPFILNDYYQTKLDDFTKGTVLFPLRNLTPGLHTISLKAWDVYNNPVTSEIQFIVAGDDTIKLTNVLNYPNPFVNYTEFWFTHNKPFEPLEVQIQVMTITGKIVWSKNQLITTEGFLSKEINWNGRDDFGDAIGKGVYVYKLTVKSTLSNLKSEKFEKLVIL
ncbi:Peptidase family C25 [Flavobacterium segetis]|uniref:Peptidase family C25 n=1 Tax=Flavobacterium segetis TaxID=271157 RepID=A0A1M5IM35_9FLAO|nr:type IX secretion system sortase PorU [Flavobacterium segetis]SHG29315.1 Peptidase family C25 [Flavobacterium segetis]